MVNEMKGEIRATAPARFDFGGAPTDVEPYRSEKGGHIINGTLDIQASVTVIPKSDGRVLVYSQNFNTGEEKGCVDDLNLEGPLKLIKAAVLLTRPTQGFELRTNVDVPPGSGLGASASLAVALLGALRTFNGETDIKSQELIDSALYIENVMLGNISGEQDQYAAALGGFHSMDFFHNGVTVEPVNIPVDTIKEIESRSLFCYSGEPHVSGQVLSDIMNAYSTGEPDTVVALQTLRDLSYKTRDALARGDIYEFGRTIRGVEEAQKKCHASIVPPDVEHILENAREHGAIGGKIAYH